ncbi:MAG: hypothetical protein LBU36_07690 [Clostridiales bacterium]|jgi:hypothetical protein|nr:hypothetical protein [Clostridiales bacterium]
MTMKFNNETVGVCAEIAIADVYGIPVDSDFRWRGDEDIIDSLKNPIKKAFESEELSAPVEYVGESQNEIDFIQESGETLSVKTNQKWEGRTCPQKVGQSTYNTFAKNLLLEAKKSPEKNKSLIEQLKNCPEDTRGKIEHYKDTVYYFPHKVIPIMIANLLNCDNLAHITNVVRENKEPTGRPRIRVIKKSDVKGFKRDDFSFTSEREDWDESITIKYKGWSVVNAQAHKKRKGTKLRFNEGALEILLGQ